VNETVISNEVTIFLSITTFHLQDKASPLGHML